MQLCELISCSNLNVFKLSNSRRGLKPHVSLTPHLLTVRGSLYNHTGEE